MADASASHLILFIASMLIATAVAGTLISEVTTFNDVIELRGSGVTEEIETDIQIINDANQAASITADGNVTIFVKNTGGTTIPADPASIDMVVGGEFVENDEMVVTVLHTDSQNWGPGTVLEITDTNPPEDLDGDTWVTVVVNGNEDTLQFNA